MGLTCGRVRLHLAGTVEQKESTEEIESRIGMSTLIHVVVAAIK